MADDGSFDVMLLKLQAGDDAAAAQLFHRFADRLIGLARHRLEPRLRQKMDPEDVLQSVFKSFFGQQQAGQLDLRNWDSLWSLLALMTVRECARRVDYAYGACRDVRREIVPDAKEGAPSGWWEALDREPTPDEAATLTETVEQLLRAFDGYRRDVIECCLQGQTVAEIAAAVHVSERTVHRVLNRVRARFNTLTAAEDDAPTRFLRETT